MSEKSPTSEAQVDNDAQPVILELKHRLKGEVAIRLLQMTKPYNKDLDWALADFSGRLDILNKIAPDDEGLDAFVKSLYELGVGGIKSSESRDGISDALSRRADDIEGYMEAHGMIDEETRARMDEQGEQLLERFGQDDLQ